MAIESVVESTVARIKEFIKEGGTNENGKLPNERELSQILQVGRSSVREALRILEAVGIIEIRPTKGSFVVERKNFDSSEFLHWFNLYQPEIFHLIEVRLALEPVAASLAAQRGTEEHFKKLEKCHNDFVQYIINGDPLKITLGDEAFHDLIFEASQNPLLQSLHEMTKKFLTVYRKQVFLIPKEAMKAVSQHDDILRCICDRDADAAKEYMVQHLLMSKTGLISAVQKEEEDSTKPTP
ncbi:FadR/GntR family transcriptional regulator [Pullulanibacillus sp. KACC 23026]|uniref:FadR/GntR family transcriptional regulator n=1 Tax=Pullulanibacillus sp. KACC 23026 TaxID=3028315 RepID=UPI0023B180C5|nr:FadR/GntR family transcriptional regulator [Pullulanibacillus sp. KACC 23026]WEG11120.1 FadR/GntR family transcriptional regulator [Pullulanibacillus sp. KACC 23026]